MQVVVSTHFMGLSDNAQAGTDLTTLLSLFALGAIPGMIAAGFIAGSFGYGAAFATAALSCLAAFLVSRAAPVVSASSPQSEAAAAEGAASAKPS